MTNLHSPAGVPGLDALSPHQAKQVDFSFGEGIWEI